MSRRGPIKKSPRKFSEKIALIKEKEALTNACFESAIQSLSEINMGKDMIHKNQMKANLPPHDKQYTDFNSISDSPNSFVSNSSNYSHESPTNIVHTNVQSSANKDLQESKDFYLNQQNISLRLNNNKNNDADYFMFRHSNTDGAKPDSLVRLLTNKEHGGSMPNVAMSDVKHSNIKPRTSDQTHMYNKPTNIKDNSSISEALSDLEDMKSGATGRKAIMEHLKNKAYMNNIHNQSHMHHPHHVSPLSEDKQFINSSNIILHSPPMHRKRLQEPSKIVPITNTITSESTCSNHHDECASSNLNEKGIMKHYTNSNSPYISVQHHKNNNPHIHSHLHQNQQQQHQSHSYQTNNLFNNTSQRLLTPQHIPSHNTAGLQKQQQNFEISQHYSQTNNNNNKDNIYSNSNNLGFIRPNNNKNTQSETHNRNMLNSHNNNNDMGHFLSPQSINSEVYDNCRRSSSDSSLVQTLRAQDKLPSYNSNISNPNNSPFLSFGGTNPVNNNLSHYSNNLMGHNNYNELPEQCQSASYVTGNRSTNSNYNNLIENSNFYDLSMKPNNNTNINITNNNNNNTNFQAAFQRLSSVTNMESSVPFQCQISQWSDPTSIVSNTYLDKILDLNFPNENVDPNVNNVTINENLDASDLPLFTGLSDNTNNISDNCTQDAECVDGGDVCCKEDLMNQQQQPVKKMSVDMTNSEYEEIKSQTNNLKPESKDINCNEDINDPNLSREIFFGQQNLKKEKFLVSQTSDPSDKCYWASSKLINANTNTSTLVSSNNTSHNNNNQTDMKHIASNQNGGHNNIKNNALIHACRNLDERKISVDLNTDFSNIADIDYHGFDIARRDSFNWTGEILSSLNTNNTSNNNSINNTNNSNNSNNNNNNSVSAITPEFVSSQISQLNPVSEEENNMF